MNTIEKLNLQLFATDPPVNTNMTSSQGMSPTMKTYYDTALLVNAREVLIFNQFAKKEKIHGNKVEFRKFNTFPKAMTPITEGVTPDGTAFGMTKIEATTTQHGDYTTVTDRLEYEAHDDIIMGATEEMGAAGGATYETLTRNIICAGNSVAYCPSVAEDGTVTEVTSRANIDKTCLLTPKIVNKANTWLKKNKAPKKDGYYIMLLHPSVAEDFRESEEWKEYHKYNDVAPIYKGEIGEMHGFRFIESNECRVHKDGKPFTNANGEQENSAVYDSIAFGADAYGVIEPESESMQMIIKDKSVIGGPLELYSTIGYKFSHGAVILYQERLLRIESGSSYSEEDEDNSEVA